MGLRDRKSRNETRRANGDEPEPGDYAGVKRRARYLKRVACKPVKIKNPEKYLNASSKRFLVLKGRVPKVAFETNARGFESWHP